MPGTVSLASALPHGFRMQLQETIEIAEPTQQDPTRKVKINRFAGKVVEIPRATIPRENVDFDNLGPRIGGYAIVHGLDKDFVEKWKHQMADWEPLASGAIRIDENPGRLEGWARENRGRPIGFEPLNPRDLPHEFKGQIEEAPAQQQR